MKSSHRLQNKLWQLDTLWLPPFLVPAEPGSPKPPKDETRWLYLDFNFIGLVNQLWKLSLGWLELLFLPPPERDAEGRIVAEPKVRNFELPITRQLATSLSLIIL